MLNGEPRGDRDGVGEKGRKPLEEDGSSGEPPILADCDRKGEIWFGTAGTWIVGIFL